MGINRLNGFFLIREKRRGIKMEVAVDRTDEAIAMLQHAREFYREDTATAPVKRVRRAAEEAPAAEPEKKKKAESPFKIRIKSEDGEVTKYKPAGYLAHLISQSKGGKIKYDTAIAELSSFVKGGKQAAKELSAKRAIAMMVRNSDRSGIALNDDGTHLVSVGA